MNISLTNTQHNILRYVLSFCIVSIFLLGNFAEAQNLQTATATAKLSDIDNNGYANLGDKITPISIYLDGVPTTGTDSIYVGVVFGYYGNTDTVYLNKFGGSAGGGRGNNVFASFPNDSIISTPIFSPGLNGVNASTATTSANGILKFLLFKKTSAPFTASPGPKTILETFNAKLVSDGLSSTPFNNIVDNVVPTIPVSDSLTVTDNAPTAFRAGVGDVINLRVDTLGTGGFTSVFAQFNTSTDRDNAGVPSTSLLQLQTLGSGTTQTVQNNLKQLSGTTSYTGNLTLGRGALDNVPPATSNLGLQYYLVDAAGNVTGPVPFENSPKAIDNTVSDLYALSGSDSLVTVSDSLTDLTTDGIVVSGGLESYIVGSKVVFKYIEPTAGNVQSANINLTLFGIPSTLPMTYSYQTGGGQKVFLSSIQTFAATATDGNLNTIRPLLTLTDSAGNIFSGGVGSFASIRRMDLMPPGNFTVTPVFTDGSVIIDNIANPNDFIKFTLSGLNSDVAGYRIMANKPNIAPVWTATQRDLNAGSFPTTGSINNGAVPVAGVFSTSNTSVLSYTPASNPAGLNIAANAASGLTTIIVRDEAGNEAITTTTYPFAINNIIPNPAQTATVTLSNDLNGNNIANIGDSLLFTISGSGVDNAIKDAYVQVLSRQFGNVGQQTYNDIDDTGTDLTDDDGGNTRSDWIKLTRVSGNFVGKIPVIRDLNGEMVYLSALANTQTFSYQLVDSAGNNSGVQTTTALAQPFDNKVDDLYSVVGPDTTVAVVDSLTNATTDGIAGAYIIGTTVKFKYTEPAIGNVSSVTIDLSAFGGGSAVAMPLNNLAAGIQTFATTLTLASAPTDAVLNTIRPRMTIVDASGNTYNGFAKINVATKVDLIRPSSGTLSVALSLLAESTTPNNIANTGEQLRAIISGLNVDNNAGGGYRIFAFNPNINTNFTGAQRNLITSTFPVTGSVDGSALQTISTINAPLQTNGGNYNVGSFTTLSVPNGLNIAANANAGRTLFIIRDDAGNEDTISAVMPFALDNIIPATPQTATYTLQYDATGNNSANIGDSVKITVSGSGVDANLASVYARVPSTIFGSVGQQNYTDIDRFGTDLADDDGGGDNLPDYIRLTKVGSNFVATFRLISDITNEFVGQESTPGTATLFYHIVDNGGNNQSGIAVVAGNTLATTALPQRFDNKIPAPSTIAPTMSTTNPTAFAGFTTTYISVGSSVTINVPGVPADVDTVFADLRPLGLTANEALLKPALNVTGTATKTFIVSAATTTYMDYPSAADSARIPITLRDQAGNTSVLNTATISSISGSFIRAVDRNVPTTITQGRVTVIHTDFDANNAVTPSDNNGKINVGERLRIIIDVSNQPDFFTANLGTGRMVVDLSAFGQGVPSVVANNAAPSPGLPGAANAFGYDPATNRFVFDFDVANGGSDNLTPGSVGIIVRNLVDNAGNQSNPTNTNTLYTNLTVPQAIDAQQPTITIPPSNSFAFSPNTDVNGDGIAAIGDGVTVNAIVVGADSVFADLRNIGRGIAPMTLGSGNTWSIASTTVLQGNDMQWASDNDFGATSVNIIAQDVNGNQSTATTAALNVDNLVTKAPTMTVQPASGGRFAVRIEDGQSTITPSGTLAFSTDMSGGSVLNTSLYQIYFDSTGTGTFSLAGTVAYGNPATFTSSQVFSEGKVVSFRVVPLDDAGNTGTTSITGTAVAQITLPPAITYEPADQTIIGSTGINLRARIDSANIDKITAVTFRARPVDSDAGTNGNQPGLWFTIGAATKTGEVWTRTGVAAGTFTGVFAVGNAYQIIAVLTDNASPANVQTNEQALAANGSITIYADDQVPSVTLSSVLVNGLDSTFTGLDNSPNPFLDIKARGIVAFKFTITDNLPLNNNIATMSFFVNNVITVNTQTIASLIANGMVSVNGNVYTVRLNTAPYASLNIPFGIIVNDGRGNANPNFGSLGFGYSFTFSVSDNVLPAFYLVQPFTGSTFGKNGFNGQLGLTALTNNANGWTEAIVQLSTDAAFTSPIHIGTSTIGTTGVFALPIPSSVALVSGTKYYVRAIVRDAVGNTTTTDPNMVYYDISVPSFTVSFPNAVTVNGIPKVSGTSAKMIITSSTSDLTNLAVRIRRIDLDTNNYTGGPFTQIVNANPYSYNVNFSGFFPSYDGLMVLEISGTDAAGNNFPAQYSTVYVDNRPTDYIVTSVNGDDELASFAPMVAGDTLTVQFQVKSDDIASGEFSINNYGSGNVKVLGIVSARNGRNFTVKFPIPTDANNQNVSMNPQTVGGGNDFTAVFRDSLNNATTNTQYVGLSSMGTLTVINNAQLSLIINNVQRGWVMSKTFLVTTRTTATTATFSGVRFEIKRPGNTTYEILSTDNFEPYIVNVGSTNYVNGLYVLRAVALTNVGNTEAAFDTVSVVFDNTNDRTTERAAIVSLNNARIGGGTITLSASAGSGVSRVRFQSRFMSPSGVQPAGWFTLGLSSIPNTPNTFSIILTAQDIASVYGLAITQLDGKQEFRAIAEDNAGFAHFLFNNPTSTIASPGFGAVGNIDDANEVATTTATVDVTAPSGVFNLAGVPLTTTQALSYGGSSFNLMNVIDGSVIIRASVTDTSDFGQGLVTLRRFGVRDPGFGFSAYGDQEGVEKVIATYTSASAIQYTVNSNSLIRGGLYRVQVKLRDNLGNENTIQTFDFIAGKPQAAVVGYNAEQRIMYVLGQNHAQSARLEYSTNNGASYSDVNTLSLTQFGTGVSNQDAARTGQFSLANITFPAGQVLFRVTASELTSNQFSQSRFASAPTYFRMSVGANGSWTPSNIATASVGLLLNRQQGTLNATRVEAIPAS